VWFAAAAAAGAEFIHSVHRWWNALTKYGQQFGYYRNPRKSWLTVEPAVGEQAKQVFENTGVHNTTKGQRYGIGKQSFVTDFVNEK
jgi:hypothetical protein